VFTLFIMPRFFSKLTCRTLSITIIETKSARLFLNSFLNAYQHPITEYPFMFKILIVDPNDPFRRSLKKVLVSRFPFADIREASDGNDGLEMVQGFNPNLIFLEIHLPSESGLDLARQIKIDHPEIIVVILTSYDLPEYKAAAKQSGVEHLVPKDDWTGEDMIALVHSIMADLDIVVQSPHDQNQPQRYSQ